jgi:hypothetical protein
MVMDCHEPPRQRAIVAVNSLPTSMTSIDTCLAEGITGHGTGVSHCHGQALQVLFICWG